MPVKAKTFEPGQSRILTRNGETYDVGAGQVVDVAPGHDAWMVGNEPVTSIDLQGVVGWARAPDPGKRVLTTVSSSSIAAPDRSRGSAETGPSTRRAPQVPDTRAIPTTPTG